MNKIQFLRYNNNILYIPSTISLVNINKPIFDKETIIVSYSKNSNIPQFRATFSLEHIRLPDIDDVCQFNTKILEQENAFHIIKKDTPICISP